MLKWGVIGLGNIAKRFCESLEYFDEACFYAGSSHTKEKRDAFMERFTPEKMYDDYDALLDDPEIDVVYIALPHGSHYEWSMKAMKKGKCVLCEKPAALHKEEIIEMTTYAKEHHLFFMEAMKTRFVPMINQLHREFEEGIIGDIVSLENHFVSQAKYNPQSYLFDPVQGGALYDVGIYCIAAVLDFVKSPVRSMRVKCKKDHDVDAHDQITLYFENGVKAELECGIDGPSNREMKIVGTKGTVTLNPFYRPTQALIDLKNGESFTGKLNYEHDDFYTEIKAVHEGIAYIRCESERMSHQDSIDCIALMEHIKEKIDA